MSDDTDGRPMPLAWNFCPITGDKLELANDGQSMRPYSPRARRFYYTNPVPAACCYLARGDELLFVQRAIEPRKGFWTVPGGFIEPGETPEEAALRELHEETGITGYDPVLLGVRGKPHRDAGGVIVIGYTVAKWEGTPAAATDAMDAQFFPHHNRPPLAFDAHQELLDLYDAKTLKTG